MQERPHWEPKAYGPITVEYRPTNQDFHAHLTEDRRIWAAGRSPYEAVGDLVVHHPERFATQAAVAEQAAERDAARREVETFRTWAQKLLDVSEYVGTDREDASRWQCAFGCGGYSYENVNGTAENDGGYKRTPPASHDWHTPTCRVRALAADLGLTSERPK